VLTRSPELLGPTVATRVGLFFDLY
jgi:hypothetical protein